MLATGGANMLGRRTGSHDTRPLDPIADRLHQLFDDSLTAVIPQDLVALCEQIDRAARHRSRSASGTGD